MSISKQSVALPARKNIFASGPRGSKYELDTLVPGSSDAIVLEGDGTAEGAKKSHSKLSSAVSNFRKSGGEALKNASFTIRTFEDTDEAGNKVFKVGVWRMADKVPAAAPADAGQADGQAAE